MIILSPVIQVTASLTLIYYPLLIASAGITEMTGQLELTHSVSSPASFIINSFLSTQTKFLHHKFYRTDD